MNYTHLAHLLQRLENGWRSRSSPPNPSQYPSHIRIRKSRNVQYFALSNRTDGKALPIVVAVGVNYTQGAQTIPDEKPAYSKALKAPPLVEDRVNQFESAYISSCNANRTVWVNSALCDSALPANLLDDGTGEISPYHLVMTNLSPWITTDSWNTIAGADGRNITADLLASPPVGASTNLRSPFEHIRELKECLDKEEAPVVWIGHGKDSVWEHFRILMEQMGVNNWMLTSNLGFPKASGFLDRGNRYSEEVLRTTRVQKENVLNEIE